MTAAVDHEDTVTVDNDTEKEVQTYTKISNLIKFLHMASHIMAIAIHGNFPEAQVTIGL